MKIKIIFILIIIILSVSLIFSDDTTTDISEKYDKTFEFSVGGGFNQSFVLGYYYSIYSFHSNPSEKYQYLHVGPLGFSSSLIIPASFVFYPVKFFGIGGIYTFGCGLDYFSFPSPTYVSLLNKIRLVNKFGNLNDKKGWFLFEYGITLSTKFDLLNTNKNLNMFYFGPSLFIGYEKNFKNPFAYSIGFIFDGLYNRYDDERFEDHLWCFYFGIETRFRFSLFKNFKK